MDMKIVLQTYIIPEMTTVGRYNPVMHRAEGHRSVRWRIRTGSRRACWCSWGWSHMVSRDTRWRPRTHHGSPTSGNLLDIHNYCYRSRRMYRFDRRFEHSTIIRTTKMWFRYIEYYYFTIDKWRLLGIIMIMSNLYLFK